MTQSINVFTIGFTGTTAEHFFERLRQAQVGKILDVRLHKTSQLSGFAKAADLAYFLRTITRIPYAHEPSLAPTDDILKAYKKHKGDWGRYERQFLQLMAERQIEKLLSPEALHGACLLCSEATPHHCHRRLVCDYLNERWAGKLQVQHL